MATTILKPQFCDVDTWRDVVKQNARIVGIDFVLHTNESWLPLALSQAGFFSSNSQVKKNRPDLWRDVVHGEELKINKWAFIKVCKHGVIGCSLDSESSK